MNSLPFHRCGWAPMLNMANATALRVPIKRSNQALFLTIVCASASVRSRLQPVHTWSADRLQVEHLTMEGGGLMEDDVRPRKRRARVKVGLSAMCAAAAVSLTVFTPALSSFASTKPSVLSPGSTPLGATYSTWASRWWLWALDLHNVPDSAYLEQNPGTASQPQVVDCSVQQSSHVWFLPGITPFQQYSTAYRTCAIPDGTYLFFPIVNSWVDNLNCPGQPPGTLTAQQLRGIVQGAIDSITPGSMSLQIDGTSVSGLADSTTAYRAPAGPFFYSLPGDSPLGPLFCGASWPAGTMPPPPGAFSDGVYIMLAPLAAGVHRISFTAQLGTSFSENVHYTITVGPRP